MWSKLSPIWKEENQNNIKENEKSEFQIQCTLDLVTLLVFEKTVNKSHDNVTKFKIALYIHSKIK